MPNQDRSRFRPQSIPSAIPTALLLLIVITLAWPVLVQFALALFSIFTSPSPSLADLYFTPSGLFLLARSLLIAGFIALLATMLGIPLARVISGLTNAQTDDQSNARRRILTAILLSPLWLPSTMVYAAGNLMRAPDTVLGHALISFSTSSPDRRWITIWAGYTIAVGGLAIWGAPISAVLIASGLGVRSGLYDEMAALEPLGILARARLWININRRVLVRSWVLIGVLMLGSAVPMHLAQLETWSIVIWRQLAQSPVDQWSSIWLSAWPSILFGVIGAWVVTKSIIRPRPHDQIQDLGHTRVRIPRSITILALAVWAMGAIAPLAAMLITLDDLDSVIHFWRLNSLAVRDSGLLAIATASIAMLIALLVAYSLSSPSRKTQRIAAGSVMVLCVLGLLPGVLVGASVVQLLTPLGATGWGAALLASCIRSAFLGAIIGALCAASESTERRSIRWQLAGGSLSGWITTCFKAITLPILGAGLIAGLYSMYEIEASIMVRPPAMHNLPQQLLSDLHYARLEQLSAAGVNLLLIGLLVSVIASFFLSKLGSRSQ